MKNILLVSILLFSGYVYSGVVPADVIEIWGYSESPKKRYLDKYCLGPVKPSSASYQHIRSLKGSEEIPAAKYRFTIGTEVYSTKAEAQERESLILNPGDRNSKQSKLCDIRISKRYNNVVYFIHTDVGAFHKEHKTVYGKLVNYLSTLPR